MLSFRKIKGRFSRRFKGERNSGNDPGDNVSPFSEHASSYPHPPAIDLDLWARAYEIFEQREPELLAAFKKHLNCSSRNANTSGEFSDQKWVESTVNTLLKDREEKQLRVSILGHDIRIRAQVERLAKLLLWADPIVKTAVSTQPYAALAWSGVSLLLPLLTIGTTQNEAMLQGFNSIGDLQVYWQICEKTYLCSAHQQHYQGLIQPLTKLYSYIIEYQARVICHLSRAQVSRAWHDIASSNEWTVTIETINKLDEYCRARFIPVGEQEEIRKNRDSQLQKMQEKDEKEMRLLQDLAAAAGDYKRYKDVNPKRVPGTCEWFLRDEKFHNWRDNELPALLWVSAGPGRGKSEGGHGRMDGAHALCAILHQLFTSPSTSSLIKYALRRHKENGTALTEKLSVLWEVLAECLISPDAGDIICIFDALDECKPESRREMIEILEKLFHLCETRSCPSSLKVLVTSRPYDSIENAFESLLEPSTCLRFDGDDKSEQIREEIDLVIDARVPDIARGFAADDQRKITERLKGMQNRTYLWLHLTFDIIEKSPARYGRRSDVEKLLSNLPSRVSDAYEKILSRSTDQSQTETLLQIILAAAQPLTLEEANIALTIVLEERDFESHAALESELWPRNKFQSVVTNLCGLFISVYDRRLSFIHQTAREFLASRERQGTWEGRINLAKSHSTISRACLRYLTLPDIAIPKRRLQISPGMMLVCSVT
ncbi:hypothetical protein BDW60DRAFT_220489 [Aspergillus nidulans var. acristatus]